MVAKVFFQPEGGRLAGYNFFLNNAHRQDRNLPQPMGFAAGIALAG